VKRRRVRCCVFRATISVEKSAHPNPDQCAPYNFTCAKTLEGLRLALLTLSLIVRLLFQVCLENQADVVGQRALCGVGSTLQLILLG
jgi:hypothetical protein